MSINHTLLFVMVLSLTLSCSDQGSPTEPRDVPEAHDWRALAEPQVLEDCAAFLEARAITARPMHDRPSFKGLWSSYAPDPLHPDSRYLADHGRAWVYDSALATISSIALSKALT